MAAPVVDEYLMAEQAAEVPRVSVTLLYGMVRRVDIDGPPAIRVGHPHGFNRTGRVTWTQGGGSR